MSDLPGDCTAYPELIQIYRDELKRCQDSISRVNNDPTEGPVSPHLICPPKGYATADLRIMFVGQETNGWEHCFRECQGVDHLVAQYDRFANPDGGSWRGPFMDAVRNYLRRFRREVPSCSFVWTNIVKIGCDRSGCPGQDVIDWMKGAGEGALANGWFSVVAEEVRLLKPDVVIFFTGPCYDERIRYAFPDTQFHSAGLADTLLEHVASTMLPPLSFKTWHPRAFRNPRNKEKFAAVQDFIVNRSLSGRTATIADLDEVLAAVPDVPPVPGDELP